MSSYRFADFSWFTVFGKLFLVLILLAGCGAVESGPAPTTATPIPITPTPTVVPSPTPTMAELFPNEASWHFRNQRGYSYQMSIKVGAPMRMPEFGSLPHPAKRDVTVENLCKVDPQFDIVIPVVWSAKATTIGFDTPINMRAIIASGGADDYSGRGVAPSQGDQRILVAQKFSSSQDCSSHSSYNDDRGFNVEWNDPIPTGTTVTHYFFIIVKDYFTPATPNGDLSLLDSISIVPSSGGDFADSAMLYYDQGARYSHYYSQKQITLSGKVVGT